MKLYIVRHGETLQNRQNMIQGQQPGDLSPLGLLQRERLAEHLTSHTFDFIYSSDLKRTKDTIAPYLNAATSPVHYSEAIRERNFGELEGEAGHIYLQKLKEAGQSRIDYRPPGGENFYDLQARTDAFLKEIQDKHFGHNVLLMTHGGTIRTLLASMLERSLEEFLKLEIRNTSISTVAFSQDWTVADHTINDYSHLEGLEEPSVNSSGIDVVKG